MIHLFRSVASKLWTAVIVLVILAGVAVSAARALLPELSNFRPELEEWASREAGQPVRIKAFSAGMEGLSPLLILEQVELLDPSGQSAMISVAEVRIRFSFRSLIGKGALTPSRVMFSGARIGLKRRFDGTVSVVGLEGREPASGSTDPVFLSDDGHLTIVDSELIWENQEIGAPPRPYYIEQAHLVHDDDRHQLDARLAFPDGGGEFYFAADLYGPYSRPEDWNGEIYFRGDGLALSNLLQTRMPPDVRITGVTSFEVWATREDDRVIDVAGRVNASGAVMELGEHGQDSHASFGLEEIEASFRWFDRTEGWQLDVAGLRLRGDAGRWPESELSVRTDYTGPHAWRVSAGASFLRVQDLVGIFEVVPLAGQGLEATLPALRPAADLSDLQLRYERNVDKPATWAARGSVNGFSSRALDDIPAIEGVSGRFWGNEAHGGLDLETEGLKLIFASLFRDPLQADVARGRIQWHRNTGGGWELGGHRIAVANSDVKTWSRFSLQVPEKPEEGIFLDLQMDFRDANAAAVPRYLPVAIMDEELISWLDEAFVSGRVPSGSGLVRGNLEKFPFAGSEGRFEVLFGTEDVILDYWPKWPRLQEIDADVAFLNNRFDVQVERAQMAGSEVVGARGQIDRLSEGSPFHLTGRIKGDVADGLWLLRETPLSEDMSLPDDLAGKGTLSVDLSMKIPLSDEGKLAVGARMDWKNVSLNLPDLGLEASQINGEVSLDEKLVLNSRNLTAQVFGIPLQISLSTPGVAGKPRFDRLEAEGFVPIELLRKQFPGADLRWLDGAAQGRVQLDVPWDFEDEVPRMDLRLISNLRGISVDLPAPLGKPADDVSPLNLDAVITRDGRVSKLKAKYGEVVSAEFLPSIVDNAFSLAAGVIGLGPDPVDAAGVKGLKVTGTWPELEIEPWVDWYSALPASSLEGSDAAELFPALNQVDAGFGAVDAFGEVFRDVRMELNRSDSGDWPGRFSSDRLAGAISIPRDLAEGTLVASLDYLKLDFEVSDVNTEVATQQVSGFGGGVDPVAPAESRVDPRELPQLQVDGKQLLVNGTDLGVFRVVTARKPWGQELGELSVDSSHLEVNGKGGWRVESQGQQTELSLSLKSPGLGKLLKKLGVSSNLKGAPAEFQLDYRWPAGPTDFSVATVEGTLYMKLGEGRMPKVDPGLGRALGLFNIMTLQRRLSLDFSDIFKEGFAFDKIEGHFRQADGSLFTDDFFMEGPAARIEVRGRTGLLAEDFDQVITVTPRVSSTGVIAGAIAAGPVVGAALLVANQLAGDRVDKLASSRYSLKGSWQNPAIEKLKGKTQPAANTPNDYDSIATE